MHKYRERIYPTYATNIYSTLNKTDEASYKALSRTIRGAYLRFLPQDKSARILDAGCGGGHFLYALRDAGYTDIRGVDVSAEQIAAARSLGLDVECADAFEFLQRHKDHFDVIVSKDVIEHLDKNELLDYVTLVREALKPGGIFICTVPNANSPFAARFRYRDLTHENLFTQETLRQTFSVCDLAVEYIGGEPLRPYTLKGWIRYAVSQSFKRFWRSMMLAELGPEAVGIPLEFNLVGVGRK